MIEAQPVIEVTPEMLVGKVREMHEQCYRLVQIGATPCKEVVEVNYSFDRDGRFVTLRVRVPAVGASLPSVSEVYWCAFIYENELHDLFKIQVTGNVVDYKGEFYRMAAPFPYAPTAAPAQPAAVPVTANVRTSTSAPASAPSAPVPPGSPPTASSSATAETPAPAQ